MEIKKFENQKTKFETAVKEAENLALFQSAGSAFQASLVIDNLRKALTDDVVKAVFMPLMNTRIGFKTDRPVNDKKSGKEIKPAYDVATVRDCIIDAASFGLLPTFNQMNIIAGNMYPTKEGYTALLKKLGVKHSISFGLDMTKPSEPRSEIKYTVTYEFRSEKNSFTGTAVVPKTAYSSYDQQKGKAERRAKKALYEWVTGVDLGDADTVDTHAEVITDTPAIEQAEGSNEETVKL